MDIPFNLSECTPKICTEKHFENPEKFQYLNATLTHPVLDPSGIADDTRDRKNKVGITPLEGLEFSMRSTREAMETIVGVWRGYSDELSCEYLLKKAMGLPMVVVGEGEYIKKRRFGCTCGVCTDGWLWPRMRFQLLGELLRGGVN